MTPTSLLDNDLYKFTMQRAVLESYPDATASYRLILRGGKTTFSKDAVAVFANYIDQMSGLRLGDAGAAHLAKVAPFLAESETYMRFLAGYRFDPSEISLNHADDGTLHLEAGGSWLNTILWEPPLLAGLSEASHLFDEPPLGDHWREDLRTRTARKAMRLQAAKVRFSELGTRRRRNLEAHRIVDSALHAFGGDSYVGTSNVMLSRGRAVGTMAHEWIMAHQILDSFERCNRAAMRQWRAVWGNRLGVSLTDTLGTDRYLQEMEEDPALAMAFRSWRQDSGHPADYLLQTVPWRHGHEGDPVPETLFTDGLDTDAIIDIHGRCQGVTLPSFGSGTHLTNDFPGRPPLKAVMKLWTLNGRPVAKLSDNPGKASGEPEAIAAAMAVRKASGLPTN